MNRKDQGFLNQVGGDWVSLCDNEWELLTGIMLDTRTPLERLRQVLLVLKKRNLLDYRKLRWFFQNGDNESVTKILKDASYPWYNQKAQLFNQDIEVLCPNGLAKATFEEIDSINGIGPKLASLFMRIMHPEHQDDYVVIDTHVHRYIREVLGLADENKKTYAQLSEILREDADARGMTITQLDEMIVDNGINRRLGNLNAIKPIPPRKCHNAK